MDPKAEIDWSLTKVQGFKGTLEDYEKVLKKLNTMEHQSPGIPAAQAFPTAIQFEDDQNAFWASNVDSSKVFTILQEDRRTIVDPMVRIQRIRPKAKMKEKTPIRPFLRMEVEGSFCSNALVRPGAGCYTTEDPEWKSYILLGRPFQTD